jgi:predicted NAD/FAD-dependent oxidoreductase
MTTENDRVPAPLPSSSALVLRDQDRTIATLQDTAAGVPFSLCASYQRLLLNRPLAKANFCNHERSVASKHVQGWIHLVSSNKDGVVSHGAMMMTIELRMSKRNTAYIKMLGDPEQTAVSTLIG